MPSAAAIDEKKLSKGAVAAADEAKQWLEMPSAAAIDEKKLSKGAVAAADEAKQWLETPSAAAINEKRARTDRQPRLMKLSSI